MARRDRTFQKQPLSTTQKTTTNNSWLLSRSFSTDTSQQEETVVSKQDNPSQTFNFNQIAVGAHQVTSPSQPVQAKLNIGEPGDKYEQEADRVASEVVQRIESGQIDQQPEEIQRSASMGQPVQRNSNIVSGPANSEFESQLNQSRQGGSPLAPQLRGQMESAIGADFSGVRIHNDTQSDYLNRSIQARAFTTGQDVFFSQGAYNPSSRSGKELIAHELTHVVQQGAPALQQKTEDSRNRPVSEGIQAPAEALSLQRRLHVTRTDGAIQRKGGFKDKLKGFLGLSKENPEETESLLGHQQEESDQEDESLDFGTFQLDDDNSIELSSDSVKITVGDHEFVLSRSQLQLQSGIDKKFEAAAGYDLAFTVPLGPLAPLALGFTLSFGAGAEATLNFTGTLIGNTSSASLHVEGEGAAGANVSAGAGVGVGISSGFASVTSGLKASLAAETKGSLKVEGDAATNSDLVNAGTKAAVALSGAIKAALDGAVTLSIAIFSKEFSVTFKEWTLGNVDWSKTIADIGQQESFLPSKSDLGITDNQTKDIFEAMDPAPTKTQKKWVAKLYEDHQTALAAAEELREAGVDIEEPTFWDIVDGYEEQTVYKIQNKRIVKATRSEVMPLMTTHLMEQMEALKNIDE